MNIQLRNAYSYHGLGQRPNQEDSRYPDSDECLNPSARCFLVCDGVGGAAKGEVASSTAAAAIGSYIDSLDPDTPFDPNTLAAAIDAGYVALDRVADATNSGMGTTMTLVVFHHDGVSAAHIGDSRIYQIRPGEGILYRSEDHSLVNALLRTGNITPEEAINHPRSNVITRCMSALVDHPRDMATMMNITDVAPGDVFVLCSDGVLHCVSDDELVRIIEMDTTEKRKCEMLRQMSEDSNDNNTLWMITVGDVISDEPRVDHDEPFTPGETTLPLEPPADSTMEVAAQKPVDTTPHKSFFGRISSIFKHK